jgi:hypothetical protein
MIRSLLLPLAGLALVLAITMPLRGGDYPKPSPFPISWELTFDHSVPKRLVFEPPGASNPSAYWYMTYHVANNTDRDKVLFYPSFDLMLEDGDVITSDRGVPPAVFDAIKAKERIKYLQNSNQISGELRQGDDQARDGVAIWPEPSLRMGTFSVFVSGFWGESAQIKVGDKDVTLRKTLQVTYHLDSDEHHPGEGQLNELDSQSVMR